jgi:G8 domain
MTRGTTFARMAFAGMTLLAAEARAQVLHTPHDHVPNFAASPTIRSAANGAWSAPATWTPARLPTASDVVSISHAVTYDSTTGEADVIGIEAGGVLRFATDQSTRIRVGTLLVLPNGTLEVARR